MLKFNIKIPLYNIKIIFYISDDLREIINLIKEKHNKDKLYKLPKKEINKLCGVVIGEFIPKKNLIYVLIKREKNKVNMNTLTSKIMKHNDFDFYHSDEPFARLNVFLNEKIIKNKKIKNKKIKLI